MESSAKTQKFNFQLTTKLRLIIFFLERTRDYNWYVNWSRSLKQHPVSSGRVNTLFNFTILTYPKKKPHFVVHIDIDWVKSTSTSLSLSSLDTDEIFIAFIYYKINFCIRTVSLNLPFDSCGSAISYNFI